MIDNLSSLATVSIRFRKALRENMFIQNKHVHVFIIYFSTTFSQKSEQARKMSFHSGTRQTKPK